MTEPTLESLVRRLEILERQMAERGAQTLPPSAAKDWRKSIGMYSDREVAKQIEAEGKNIREQERESAEPEDVE